MTDDLRAIIGAVLAGKLDLAVIELSLVAGEPRLAVEPLPVHPGHFFCRAGHPLLIETDPGLERILTFPLVGTRMPPRVAKDFLDLAKAGTIDRNTGDYLPPIKVDSIRMVKDVVLASDAVAVAPIPFIADEVTQRTLVVLPTRVAWMQTAYGFVSRRAAAASPAAAAFMDAVRRVEDEVVAAERRATSS
jgi:DNA-binding transcriptional LysR family regulator